MMRYLSLFSGVEAAHLAWRPIGWQCAGVAEIDPSACAALKHRLPGVPNLGSVTEITNEAIAGLGRIDVVIGGSPCQDLSVAGKRAGLSGARSSLFHEQLRIFHAARTLCGARWLVWENVPGAFSSRQGRDFAVVVGELAGCKLNVPADGWGTEGVALGDAGLIEWCVLDAQWFGVAQRRRRVFAVLDTGDWASRSPVLLERDSLRGDSAPRRETGEEVAGSVTCRTGVSRGADDAANGHMIAARWPADVAPTLDTTMQKYQGLDNQHVNGGCGLFVPAFAIQAGALRTNPESGPDGVGVQSDHAYTLEARAEAQCVAFDTTHITSAANRSNPQSSDPCHTLQAGAHVPAIAVRTANTSANGHGLAEECAHTLDGAQGQAVAVALRGREGGATAELGDEVGGTLRASQGGGDKPHALTAMQVRRLTPRECERLQGMPDDWTLTPNGKGKPMADGPRYKMLGNSFAVPCIRWIGERIADAHAQGVALDAAA